MKKFVLSMLVFASMAMSSVAQTVYYPESQSKTTDAKWWTNFSDYYTLKVGEPVEFKFYNYSNMVNVWNNWILVAAQMKREDAGYGADKEYFVIRNDNWGWGANHNAEGFTNDFDWGGTDLSNLKNDLNGSLVDMNVNLAEDGTFKMQSTITTKESKEMHYTYTTTLTAKPSEVVLFFVNEGSYIDGSSLAATTGIEASMVSKKQADGKCFNLAGQQVAKDSKGLVIMNGKKFVNK